MNKIPHECHHEGRERMDVNFNSKAKVRCSNVNSKYLKRFFNKLNIKLNHFNIKADVLCSLYSTYKPKKRINSIESDELNSNLRFC